MQENKNMRICIPTTTKNGKMADLYGHFGSAPYFTIYDTENDTVEIIDNSNQHHAHGMCHPASAIARRRIDAVACTGMGARAIQKLKEDGIKVYRATSGTVSDIIKKFINGGVEEITVESACSQHSCH
jgi:predicted Fe-Mo cluster-binding NifX family protein